MTLSPSMYTISMICRICRLELKTSSHILADCIALDFNRLATMNTTHLTIPYRLKLKDILKILEQIADQMEDTTPHNYSLTLQPKTGSRTAFLDRIEDPLPNIPPLSHPTQWWSLPISHHPHSNRQSGELPTLQPLQDLQDQDSTSLHHPIRCPSHHPFPPTQIRLQKTFEETTQKGTI